MPRNWEIYLDDFNVIDYTQTPVVENFVSNIVIKYLDD
jgi:cytochrome c biogenesis protein ResB